MDDQNKNEHLEGHVYDGIIENDNPLPTWWTWTFLLTIVFALIYYIHYEIALGPTLQDELKIAMAQVEKLAKHKPQVMETEESLLAAMNSEDMKAIGKAQFDAKCVACHGNELQGGIGPNLTDNYWLHGKGKRMDLVKIIREGVPAKGMPPWDNMLKKEEVYGLTAYILAHQGSNPKGAKEPQGEKAD